MSNKSPLQSSWVFMVVAVVFLVVAILSATKGGALWVTFLAIGAAFFAIGASQRRTTLEKPAETDPEQPSGD